VGATGVPAAGEPFRVIVDVEYPNASPLTAVTSALDGPLNTSSAATTVTTVTSASCALRASARHRVTMSDSSRQFPAYGALQRKSFTTRQHGKHSGRETTR
jgi:hypothetical protein